jgi:hypothetical protein
MLSISELLPKCGDWHFIWNMDSFLKLLVAKSNKAAYIADHNR